MASAVSDALARFFGNATHPIVFAGAGIAARAGLPQWKNLVVQLAEGMRAFDPLTTQQMLERVRLEDYTLAVDYFKLSPNMVEGEKQKLLVRLLSSFDATKLASVAQLPFRGCLTINFDRSILEGIAAARHIAARDHKLGDVSFKQAQWEEGLFVARVHGAVEAPSFASCRPRVLIRMPWLGMDAAMPFSSASARLLLASRLRMAGASKRAGFSCSSGASAGTGGACGGSTCTENAIFYACRSSCA